jgi:hypothetical protein
MVETVENILGMSQGRPQKEWFDEECKEAIRTRNLVYKSWVNQPNRFKNSNWKI